MPPVTLENLTDEHARQENMALPELKEVIGEIYPSLMELYAIVFRLLIKGDKRVLSGGEALASSTISVNSVG